MAVFNVAGYLIVIEERRRWPVITASPRGKYSKSIQNFEKRHIRMRTLYQLPGCTRTHLSWCLLSECSSFVAVFALRRVVRVSRR